MKPKINSKNQFRTLIISINREFMLQRCKLYRVRHRKNEDTLEILCLKYIRKLYRIQPWEIPDDEEGNAGWINFDRIFEDYAIKLKFAEITTHPKKRIYVDIITEEINYFVKQFEDVKLFEKPIQKMVEALRDYIKGNK